MISVAIVENDENDAALLKKYILQYGTESGSTIETAVFSSGVLFLNAYTPNYDVIFMDIEMPGLNGMETAAELRKRDGRVKLIFVTNMAKYAIQGYSVGAMDYILKPVRYPDIKMRMERIRQTVTASSEQVAIPYQGGVRLVDPKDIIYIESVSHRITFHTTAGDFSGGRSMNEWEAELMGKGFSRCNTSYIVNIRYCKEVSGNTLKIGDEELQISRARKKDFVRTLMHSS